MKRLSGFICNIFISSNYPNFILAYMNSKENQMASSSNEDDYHHLYAMQLASASVMPMVLKAAIELGVFDILERAGPGALLSSAQIASHLPVQNNSDAPFMLDRILRLLVSHSVLTCSLDTTNNRLCYGLSPVAKYFIKNQDGGSLTPVLLTIQDKVLMDMWYHLKDAVLEGGKPFDRAHGMNGMDYMKKDARFFQVFSGFLKGFNPLFIKRVLEIYNGFEGLKSLIDVGGGDGFVLNMIISKFPNIKGINYDLASVIEKSPSYPGIENVGGDMFVSIPKGDAILMKNIVHSWDDEQSLKLLKNCYEALPINGKVIVMDMVVPGTIQASTEAKSLMQLYVCMASMNPTGKERTEREWESLAKEAGFSHIRVAGCAYACFSVIELFKSM